MTRWLYMAVSYWIGLFTVPIITFVWDEWRRYKRNKELL